MASLSPLLLSLFLLLFLLPLTHSRPPPQPSPPHRPFHPRPVQIMPWLDEEDESDDLVTQFSSLPSHFHNALLPDLNHSHAFLNHHLTPTLGPTLAPHLASLSLLLPLLPLLFLLRRFNRFPHAHLLLLLLFSLSAAVGLCTRVDPWRYCYAIWPGVFVAVQVVGLVGYVVVVVVGEAMGVVVGDRWRVVGVVKLGLGLVVGLHYYAVVFHRIVRGQPPRIGWKVHAVYAVVFAVVCGLNAVERRRVEYVTGKRR